MLITLYMTKIGNKKIQKKILALQYNYDIFDTFLRCGRNRNGWRLARELWSEDL